MDQQKMIADIERKAWELRVSIRFVCQRAGLSQSTFTRWKLTEGNPEPVSATLKSIEKMEGALAAIAQEQRRSKRLRTGDLDSAVAA